MREVREETGLEVVPGPLIGAVDRPRPDGRVLVIRDYAATVTGGTLTAGDDADDARWFSMRELADLAPHHRSGGGAERMGRARRGSFACPGRGGDQARGGDLADRARSGTGQYPAWHLWRDPPGAAYLVTGPGEQPLPGAGRGRAGRGHRAEQGTGGALVSWAAGVSPGGSGVTGVGRGHRTAGGRPAQRRTGPRPGDGVPARTGIFWRLTRSRRSTDGLFTRDLKRTYPVHPAWPPGRPLSASGTEIVCPIACRSTGGLGHRRSGLKGHRPDHRPAVLAAEQYATTGTRRGSGRCVHGPWRSRQRAHWPQRRPRIAWAHVCTPRRFAAHRRAGDRRPGQGQRP